MSENYLIKSQKVVLVKDGPSLRISATPIGNSEAAQELCQRLVGQLPHEEMHVVGVNHQHRPRATFRVSQGGICGCAVKPSDVFRPLIVSGLPAFIVTHNHPSGVTTPSDADWEMTRLLVRGCALLGLTLLDHIVVGDRDRSESLLVLRPEVFAETRG